MPRVKKDATPITIKMDRATFDRLGLFVNTQASRRWWLLSGL